MLRFLHAADLHLDSPLKGLARYEGAPVEVMQQALRGAVENLVRLAIEREASLVVIAGDVYDGDCRDFNTPLFFSAQMQRLAAEGIHVVLISGNHDAANKMTRSLRLPPNCRTLAVDEAETVTFDDLGVAVHGQGFARADVCENLAASYPAAVKGLYNIGLLHTCATGSDRHEKYAPCSLDDLRRRQYDYWALGHVHKRDLELCIEPRVVFPGNVQGRDIGETGAKGCVIVEVDNAHNTQVEFVPLDVLRWEHVAVDLATAENEDEVLALVRERLSECWRNAEGLPTAVRVTLAGATAMHEQIAVHAERIVQEVRNPANHPGDGSLWIEKVLQRTAPRTIADDFALDGPLGELTSVIRELRHDDKALLALAEELPELRATGTLAEFRGDSAQGGDFAWLRDELAAVESLLVGHLRGEEERR
ncbi:MAG: DNA repair exonuclease [Planctomycetota bacterium]|nr:MAG: DNA repair exonuclease [Planctomycetota bacterium]